MKSGKYQVMATVLAVTTLLCTGCKPAENSLSTSPVEEENSKTTTFKIFQPITIKSTHQPSDLVSEEVKEAIEYAQEVKVGIVNDGYQSSNQSLISKLTNELTAQLSNIVVETVTPEMNNVNSYLNSVNDLIAQGVQVILIPNQMYEKDLEPIIKKYQDIVFVTLDSFTHASNVLGLKFRDESSAFLAGVIAAAQSTTQRVAYLGYEENKQLNQTYIEGFKAGAKAVNDQIIVSEGYISQSASSLKVKEKVQSLYQDQYDIIFEDLNAHQQDVILTAKEFTMSHYPVWVINSVLHLSNQAEVLYEESVVLSSTVKNIDVALCNVLNNLLNGNLVLGTQIILGLENNGVDVTLTSQSLSQSTSELVHLYKEKIINGEVIVPTQLNTVE